MNAIYLHLRDVNMKQEKLCETEDMTDKDYSRWYEDPVAQQTFAEELGAENERVRRQLRDAEILSSFPEDFKALGLKPKRGYWEEKAAHNAKMEETMTKLYSEHKTVRDRQVGGDHYKNMRIQPWDIIDQGPSQQSIGFYRYNALKYIMRAGEKGDFKEDIAKAQHYLEKLLAIL